MRPRPAPFLVAALLTAGACGALCASLVPSAPAVAHRGPQRAVVALAAESESAGAGVPGAILASAPATHVEGRLAGDLIDSDLTRLSASAAAAPTPDASVAAATADASGTGPAPVAVVIVMTPAPTPPPRTASAPARTPAPPSRTPAPPPPATPQPSPPAPPAPTPTPPPAAAPPPSDTQPPASTPYSRQQIIDMIRAASAAHGVNGDCMVSLATRESGLNPNAINRAGPYDGLFQFWPPTYRAHGGSDIWDPRQQSDVAATMMAQGGGPGAWGIAC